MIQRAKAAFAALAAFIHPRKHKLQWPIAVLGSIAGIYLIHLCNHAGYYAIMKRAPPVGCLWIWLVFEMDLLQTAISVPVVFLYFYGELGGYI